MSKYVSVDIINLPMLCNKSAVSKRTKPHDSKNSINLSPKTTFLKYVF